MVLHLFKVLMRPLVGRRDGVLRVLAANLLRNIVGALLLFIVKEGRGRRLDGGVGNDRTFISLFFNSCCVCEG